MLAEAKASSSVCVWSTVARAEEREKEESTGLAVTANTATAAHLTPRSFTHRHRQRGTRQCGKTGSSFVNDSIV